MAVNCYGNRFVFNEKKLGGNFQLVIYSSSQINANTLAKEAYQLVDSLNTIFSSYLKDSEISYLNNNRKLNSPSKELLEVLKISKDAYLKTNGYFNIAILPLIKVWEKAYKSQKIPSSKILEKQRKYIDLDRVLYLNNEQIILKNKSGLVLGGIAKGFIIDQVYNLLKLKKATAFLVEAAGDIRVFGKPEESENWTVGISSNSKSSFYVSLKSGQAIATSGKTYRYKWIDKKKYSHILNPKSLSPVTENVTASVIANSAFVADYLASTFNVVTNKNKIKDILGNHKNICLLMFNRNGVIFRTENFNNTEI